MKDNDFQQRESLAYFCQISVLKHSVENLKRFDCFLLVESFFINPFGLVAIIKNHIESV